MRVVLRSCLKCEQARKPQTCELTLLHFSWFKDCYYQEILARREIKTNLMQWGGETKEKTTKKRRMQEWLLIGSINKFSLIIFSFLFWKWVSDYLNHRNRICLLDKRTLRPSCFTVTLFYWVETGIGLQRHSIHYFLWVDIIDMDNQCDFYVFLFQTK